MRIQLPSRHSRELELLPFRELGKWHHDIDSLFSRLLGWRPFEEELFETSPALESFVRDGDLVVRADLPGVDPKDVDISVLDNVLTIKGERRATKEAKEEDYVRHEISYGSFERQMTLPAGVEADKIKAKYENGVLEVSMPAPKRLSGKKIPIQIGVAK